MNIRRAMDEHGQTRLFEIDEEIKSHMRAVRALYAERIAVTMHLFVASVADEQQAEGAP
jgi:adenylate kinase